MNSLYAENPDNNFAPSPGFIHHIAPPSGPGIREDSGVTAGNEISLFYDPMISKLITYGATREEAIQGMIRAIDGYLIQGVETTLPFGRFVMNHEAFRSGDFDTHFVSKYYSPEKLMEDRNQEMEVAAKLALRLYLEERKKLKTCS